MNAPLRIVLDTNVLIASIGRSSPLRWLFEALLAERFTLCLSQPVLFEYETVLARKTSSSIAENVTRMLLVLPNAERIDPHYQWRLVFDDPDDDKFVDLALAAGADALVTNDRHFDRLNDIDFPPIRVVTPSEFSGMLN